MGPEVFCGVSDEVISCVSRSVWGAWGALHLHRLCISIACFRVGARSLCACVHLCLVHRRVYLCVSASAPASASVCLCLCLPVSVIVGWNHSDQRMRRPAMALIPSA